MARFFLNVTLFAFAALSIAPAHSQELPADELQVSLNSYFDSWDVEIVYPTISYTRHLTDSATINLRYLVDVISAASMRSHFVVDGVTSATEREDGGSDDSPDELRQEVGAGITQLVAGGALSVNALYSKEHDYSSATLAGSYAYQLAQKNTTLQLGLVRSWDKNFPQTRIWSATKDVYSASFNITQVLSKRMIAQAITSYNYSKGFLSDPYQVVQILQGNQVLNLEPVHPDKRIRKAVGVRINYKVDRKSALQFGMRYYWDDWEVNSLTTSILFQQHVGDAMTVGLGFRNYFQGRAFFYQEEYAVPAEFMTVDSKLDEGFANEYQFKLTLDGSHLKGVPLLHNDRTQIHIKLNFYHRHTATPNWHRRAKDLYAYIMSMGVRYRF